MMLIAVQIIAIAILASIAAVLPGVFLVLRRMALMSDAISHAVLPGIVLTFLIIKRLDSAWLMVGATCAGVCTVLLIEALVGNARIKQDAAVGLVYPVFFSIGVILVSCFARNVHLDTDMVLLGDIAFAPLHHVYAWGIDWGPRALWSVGVLLIANATFVLFFYKELVLACFDWDFARSSGSKPRHLHYALMVSASATAVVLFDIVGSIMVVALMIIPAATALIRAQDMRSFGVYACLYSVAAVCLGYIAAILCDISIAGSIAATSGMLLVPAVFFNRQHRTYAGMHTQKMLRNRIVMHYLMCQPQKQSSCQAIADNHGWSIAYIRLVVDDLVKQGLVCQLKDVIMLSTAGVQVYSAKNTISNNAVH
jgi:manganese/zinc/iron transport system permease protein